MLPARSAARRSSADSRRLAVAWDWLDLEPVPEHGGGLPRADPRRQALFLPYGTELGYLSIGITAFKIVNFDIASALDTVKISGDKLPQGLMGSIGFQISW